jgi:tetraacyldisaccharide 4'-kinase
MIRFLRLFLFPFAIPYFIITEFKNFLYLTRIKRGTRFDRPVICIGNLSTGGTGKTPMIEYVIRLLKNNQISPAVLSRGYRRNTHGYLKVEITSGVKACGDEPLQIKQKFKDIDVAVCESRVDGIIEMVKENEAIDVILLDDAFQHRSVKPSFSILTSSFYQPFFTDFILPVGDLREMRKHASRAQAVVITKCPDWMTEVEMLYYERGIRRYTKAPVYFSKISYTGIKSVFENSEITSLPGHVFLVTGIANPQPLTEYIESKAKVQHLGFPDHHLFDEKNSEQISRLFNSFAGDDKILLTTEKDAKRFQSADEKIISPLKKLPFYFIEMETEILQWKNKESLDQLILSHVENFK